MLACFELDLREIQEVMAKFVPLKVAEIRRETEDSVSIRLDVPAENAEEFKFISGQYVTFKKDFDGEEIRRSYSICSAPYEEQLWVGVKKMIQGRFSTFANDVLKVGDTLETLSPRGKFMYHPEPNEERHFVGFGGGSGITPVLGILKDVLHSEPNSRFTLFYGNRNAASVIFKEQLEQLKNKYMNRLTVHHIFSEEEVGSDLFQGLMNKEKIEALSKSFLDMNDVDGFYICGPEPMILAARDHLKETGADEEKVHFELFASGPPPTTTGTQPAKPAATENVSSKVKVVMDGDEFELALDSNGPTILDAATEAGLDVPFSCKGAVCCTCLARVKQGEVSMDLNYSLSDKEVEEGLILTCQAHPQTSDVIVDYDDIW